MPENLLVRVRILSKNGFRLEYRAQPREPTYRCIKENPSKIACILQEPAAAYNPPHFGYEMVI